LSGQTMNTLTAQEKAQGWQLLLDGKTLDGWHPSAPPQGQGRASAPPPAQPGTLAQVGSNPKPCVTALKGSASAVPAGSSRWEVVDGLLMPCGEPTGYLTSDHHVLDRAARRHGRREPSSSGASLPRGRDAVPGDVDTSVPRAWRRPHLDVDSVGDFLPPRSMACPGFVSSVVGPPLRTIDHSITAMASISIRKPGSASAATPTQVEAGVASPEKNSRNAPATASALWASYATT
jgi:hypothetical protein